MIPKFLSWAVFTLMVTVATAGAEPATQPASSVNLLAMGDWGTGQPEQKKVAAAIVKYVQGSTAPVDGMLLVGDNFYVDIPKGIDDPVFQTVFEKVYDPAILKFPF